MTFSKYYVLLIKRKMFVHVTWKVSSTYVNFVRNLSLEATVIT